MTKKILIIDDEHIARESVKKALVHEGFDVIEAKNGEEGFERAVEDLPNLILLDLVMPKQDGLTTLKVLREDERTKSIPVIILTNLMTDEAIEEALRSHSTDYLLKINYSLRELVEKVKSYLT